MKHGVTRYRITLECYEAAHVSGRAKSAAAADIKWLLNTKLSSLPLSTTGRQIASFV
jgi:A/G-specific adenine glycosylase